MKYFIVDAFAENLFNGNQAGVCMLENELSEKEMQNIAAENNLAETAFLLKTDVANKYNLRWFTPQFEIDLCGHATLAAAYIVLNALQPQLDLVNFKTKSGILTVTRRQNMLQMQLPLLQIKNIPITQQIIKATGITPCKGFFARDLFLVLQNSDEVRQFVPDYKKLASLKDYLGIVVTAKANEKEKCDFVSRYFCPELECEDAVTGSAHCALAPYWANVFGKNKLTAKQLSARGGMLKCIVKKDCVDICGYAKLYMQGEILI